MRNGVLANRLGIETRDGFGDDDALFECAVSQCMARRHISYRPYARFVGAAKRICGNMAALRKCDAP